MYLIHIFSLALLFADEKFNTSNTVYSSRTTMKSDSSGNVSFSRDEVKGKIFKLKISPPVRAEAGLGSTSVVVSNVHRSHLHSPQQTLT